MKKKILLILLCGVCLLGVTGCGSKENESDKKENSKNKELSKVVKLGDYVSYYADEDKTYTSKKEKTGYTEDQTFKVKGDEKWRVFSINKDNTIDLISSDIISTNTEQGFYIYGKTGYDNANEELKNIVKIFGTGKYAKKVRSMTENDLKKYLDLKSNIKEFEKEYKVDLTEYESNEELWDAMNKTVNKEDYGKEFQVGDEKVKINSGLTNNTWLGMHRFNLEDYVSNTELLSTYTENERVWLGSPFISKSTVGLYDTYVFTYGISYYYSGGDYAYCMSELYHVQADKTGKILDDPSNSKWDAYIRPIVTIKSDTLINDGNGTVDSPYTLK